MKKLLIAFVSLIINVQVFSQTKYLVFENVGYCPRELVASVSLSKDTLMLPPHHVTLVGFLPDKTFTVLDSLLRGSVKNSSVVKDTILPNSNYDKSKNAIPVGSHSITAYDEAGKKIYTIGVVGIDNTKSFFKELKKQMSTDKNYKEVESVFRFLLEWVEICEDVIKD